MNSAFSRVSSFFDFSMNVMLVIFFACYLTTARDNKTVPVDIRVSKVILRNVDNLTGPGEQSDLVFIQFDLSADFKPIFNWNVRQLFLFLSAEYATGKHALNQVMLWDAVVFRSGSNKVDIRGTRSKYFFCDDGNGLRANKNVTLTLSWNVIPISGRLAFAAGRGNISLHFPDKYETPKLY